MPLPFKTGKGSAIGRHHKETHRNNQDAFHYILTEDIFVGVICDGCSESKASEVGASIGSRIITESVYAVVKDTLSEKTSPITHHPLWEVIRQQILVKLLSIAHTTQAPIHDIIRDYFLFTIIGCATTEKECVFFSVGDGYIVINGAIESLGPFPDNQPPYLAYDIPGNHFIFPAKNNLHFTLKGLPTEEITSALIASDGLEDFIAAEYKNIPGKNEHVGPISQFWQNPIYTKNPDAIRRKLTLVNTTVTTVRQNENGYKKETALGLLRDDTTLIVLTRQENEVS